MNTRIFLTLGATLLLAAGCATAPKTNPVLEQARSAVSGATANPDVVKHSRLELEKAESRLSEADKAMRERKEPVVVDHLAYLAKNHALTAEADARKRVAELKTEEAGSERDRIRLQVRTTQLESEQRRSEQARLAAQQAQQSAQTAQANADNAEARAAALAQELQAKQTERGLVLTLGDVLFDTAQADLKPGAMPTIEKLGTFLQENPERRVQVEGFTDSIGADDYNLSLSQRRADAVRSAILSRGVPAERVAAQGFGESRPVAGNDNAGGRQMNRRVEIVIGN